MDQLSSSPQGANRAVGGGKREKRVPRGAEGVQAELKRSRKKGREMGIFGWEGVSLFPEYLVSESFGA